MLFDFVPNQAVSGTNRRNATGILYKIGCDTENGAERYLSAFPKSVVIRPEKCTSHQGQLWSIASSQGHYKISCDTQNGGLRYVSAFPKSDVIRPEKCVSHQDQL